LEFETDILNCLRVLQSGGLILYPSDTIWGIGCDATNSEAVKKVYRLKKRPDQKSMIILVDSEKEISEYVSQPDLEIFNYLKSVKKPTTVIYQGVVGLAAELINDDGTVAIRICKKEFCNQLVERFGRPIVSTSANISGDPFPKNFSEISAEIKSGVDYVVQYRQDDNSVSEPSTLIKWEKGKPIILRP